MLRLKTLTMRNFMSIGNVTQVVNFNNNELSLVLGENLDLGGNDNRNGTGKTSIINCLSYALFGQAISNIKLSNLINLTNEKNMYVTLDFEKDGNDYRIERGRKPNIFKFIVNNQELNIEDSDEAQGDSRLTQQEVVKVLGLTHEMFKHIVALNTYTEPFLVMRANDQRAIIEELLGITKLSEKAEKLKELVKETREKIKEEEFRISAVKMSNENIEKNIITLENKSKKWEHDHNTTIEDTIQAIEVLRSLDIDEEIKKHKEKDLYANYKKSVLSLTSEINNCTNNIKTNKKFLDKLSKSVTSIMEQKCPECSQSIANHDHEKILVDVEKQVIEVVEIISSLETKKTDLQKDQDNLIKIKEPSDLFYNTIDEAFNHKSSLDTCMSMIEKERNNTNPFLDQIEQLKTHAIQEIDFDTMNTLSSLRDHQEFLLKLLTNKDSFIRKKIIDQNLSYLNSRLSYFLEKTGLPHEVKFLSDLTVEISEHGRPLDFDNLSRGERTRLILSMSWSFRDVYESMNGKINLLFVDEIIDNGLDTSGVESCLGILKKMSRESERTIFLVSHREELLGRIDAVLKVVKEHGFTTFSVNEEVTTEA